MTVHNDEWLTVSEACSRLKVTRATLYRWARLGKLRMYRLGERTTRVRREDIESLITPRYRKEHVTVVGLSGFEVLDITPDMQTVRDVVARFAPDLSQDGEVHVNQERCKDLEKKLAGGDVIVVLPHGVAESLRSDSMSEEEERGWLKLAESSFAKDWDNESDAIYDNWKELYGVSGQ